MSGNKTAWDRIKEYLPQDRKSWAWSVIGSVAGSLIVTGLLAISFRSLVEYWFPERVSFEGAVVAFDRTLKDRVCPQGWTLFEPAGGRTIVGAGSHQNTDANGRPLTNYPAYQDGPSVAVGGEEAVTLTLNQVPEHTHSYDRASGSGTKVNGFAAGAGENEYVAEAQTSIAGKGQAHNNMPPYLALFFCRKN